MSTALKQAAFLDKLRVGLKELYNYDLPDDIVKQQMLAIHVMGKQAASRVRTEPYYTPELRPAIVEYINNHGGEVLSRDLFDHLQKTRPMGTVSDPVITRRRMDRTISKDAQTFIKKSAGAEGEYFVRLRGRLSIVPTAAE